MELTDFLTQHGVDFKQEGESPHVTSGWIGLICPYCGEGTGKYGLGINLERLCASCWKCGTHKLTNVLMDITKLHWQEIKKVLAGIERPFYSPSEISGTLELPYGLQPLIPTHKDYLRFERRFDPNELEKLWKLQSIGLAHRLAFRIFIPIHLNGEIVSWTTRATVDDAKDRYITAHANQEKLKSKSLLLGEDFVRHAIIITEGPFDAFRIGPGAVATFGTGYSKAQVLRASKYPLRVVMFDNEQTAQAQAAALTSELSVFPGKTLRVEIDAKDPGEASPEEVARIRKHFLE